jgi:hypothetical protein
MEASLWDRINAQPAQPEPETMQQYLSDFAKHPHARTAVTDALEQCSHVVDTTETIQQSTSDAQVPQLSVSVKILKGAEGSVSVRPRHTSPFTDDSYRSLLMHPCFS